MNKTIVQSMKNQDYQWYVIDAKDKHLGRLSTEISKILLGKNDPNFHPSQKANHAVIVINAEKIQVTGKKRYDKFYKRYSGYQGGLTIETFDELQKRIPNRVIEKAVKGMLPKGALGRDLFTKLKVYAGQIHPHEAQKPKSINFEN
uniref:Ribosomal protein L13 n=1 Tax=Storeatula sp. CCMP1868 TaxID=195070 RepID=A0A222AHZ3_9CRYP|nr:ribosomal protein L13 [Storeatula sp. CCMP1868]